jgi:ATP-grasp domain-containing protein
MLRDDGSFSIIEMNPRFSGTLALTTAAGINFASLLLDAIEGKPVPDLLGRHEDGVTMMRYWSEVFEDRSGNRRLGTALEAARGHDPGLAPKFETERRTDERMIEPFQTPVAHQTCDGGEGGQNEADGVKRPKVGS